MYYNAIFIYFNGDCMNIKYIIINKNLDKKNLKDIINKKILNILKLSDNDEI